MTIKIFCHSLLSDWNHGNAHFLRGIATELIERGHRVDVYEPKDAWSLTNLLADRGPSAVEGFRRAYPLLDSIVYDPATLDLNDALGGADLVLVHEWNDHDLVRRIGEHRAQNPDYRLLFHDTHHRSVTEKESMAGYDLSNYDGVLAFGEVIRRVYLENGWTKQAWTWHEAADPRVFHPMPGTPKEGDLVWVGNWGDEERTEELHEFLLRPVKELGLKATVYGVRYPEHALAALKEAGITYGGSLANYDAPATFAKYRVTVHVPRRPYVRALPGIPTIRVFEALACGIPLVSAPWNDAEGLFSPGEDFAVAQDGEEMKAQLRRILDDPGYASSLSEHGRRTVLNRHTCAHRVDELLDIMKESNRETTSAGSPR
ncbi:glycosyltransferase [bacterium]|nr:MAG: glycosyltransferase [bacterium]